jgi:hypothetical protein
MCLNTSFTGVNPNCLYIHSQLLEEIAQHDKDKENKQNNKSDWEKTTIAPFVKHFCNFVHGLENAAKITKAIGLCRISS